MFGFAKKPFDRDASLRRAEEFRARKKPKKAIAELKKVLAADSNDPAAHAKLGPLLMMTGRRDEALLSFRIAADDLDARGFADKALSLWLQIAQLKVADLDAWEKVTQFHASRGRKADAVRVLLEAASLQRGRDGRARAVRLLEDALVFEPQNLPVMLKLAPMLAKEGRREDARTLLEDALKVLPKRFRRPLRWKLFVLFPGFGTFFRWLRG